MRNRIRRFFNTKEDSEAREMQDKRNRRAIARSSLRETIDYIGSVAVNSVEPMLHNTDQEIIYSTINPQWKQILHQKVENIREQTEELNLQVSDCNNVMNEIQALDETMELKKRCDDLQKQYRLLILDTKIIEKIMTVLEEFERHQEMLPMDARDTQFLDSFLSNSEDFEGFFAEMHRIINAYKSLHNNIKREYIAIVDKYTKTHLKTNDELAIQRELNNIWSILDKNIKNCTRYLNLDRDITQFHAVKQAIIEALVSVANAYRLITELRKVSETLDMFSSYKPKCWKRIGSFDRFPQHLLEESRGRTTRISDRKNELEQSLRDAEQTLDQLEQQEYDILSRAEQRNKE